MESATTSLKTNIQTNFIISERNSVSITRICKTCGGEIKIWPSLVKDCRGIFCSNNCRKRRVKVVCLNCGKGVEVKYHRKDQKYCSKECLNEARNKNNTYICIICGEVFKRNPSKVKKYGVRYCSTKCSGVAHNRKIKCICKQCDKEFCVKPSRIKSGKGIFCSRKCKEAWQSQNIKCENSPTWRGGKIKIICKQCGKIFYKFPSQINSKTKNIFCSTKCMGMRKSGANSIYWKGGISFKPYCPKFNKNLKEKVRRFFNHKCILCGKSEAELGYKLHVHHVDYEKETCCNGMLDPLFVLLCNKCHPKTNGNRYEWEVFFRYYLALGYNNKCF